MTATAEMTDDTALDDAPAGTAPAEGGPDGAAEAPAVGPLTKTDGTPYTQADIDGLHDALRKARRDARSAARGRGVDAPPDVDAPDVDKVRADSDAAAATKWKPMVVRSAARTAFVEAGLTLPKDGADGAMARVVRLLDLNDIDVNDDGEVDGLREQVEDIRRDFPELFAPARRTAARIDAAGKVTEGIAPKTSAERLAAQLLG